MSSEPQKETTPEDQERSEREATFSRRGLLQWSVPAILAVSLPAQVSAGTGGHSDTSHTDHEDHNDAHGDGHTDTHTDSHGDFTDHVDAAQRAGGKNSGVVPNLSTTPSTPTQGTGVVPSYGGGSAPTSGQGGSSVVPGKGGSGVVPNFTPPAKK